MDAQTLGHSMPVHRMDDQYNLVNFSNAFLVRELKSSDPVPYGPNQTKIRGYPCRQDGSPGWPPRWPIRMAAEMTAKTAH